LADSPSRQERQTVGAPNLSARRLVERARRALQDGDRAAAQAAYEQALAADPDLQEAWLGLAELAPDPLFARALCERILQKWPDCQEARRTLRRLEVEAGVRRSSSPGDEDPGVPEAAVRAGAPLYRGSHGSGTHGKGGDVPAWAELDLQGDEWGDLGETAPRHPRAASRLATGPWLSLLLIAALLVISIGASTLWRQADAEPAGRDAPVSQEGALGQAAARPNAPPKSVAPPSPALRYLSLVPAQRWIEIVPAEGRLTVYQGRQAVRTLTIEALRALPSHQDAAPAAGAIAPHEAQVSLQAAPWRTPDSGGGAFYYALDLTPGDAWWLASWLASRGPRSGQLYLAPGRILIPLD